MANNIYNAGAPLNLTGQATQGVGANAVGSTYPQSATPGYSVPWSQPGLVGGAVNNTSVVIPGVGNSGSYGALPTNTLTSNDATSDLNDTSAIIAQEQADLQSQYQNAVNEANNTFNLAQSQLQDTQAKESGAELVTQGRLGQTGSDYALAQTQKLDMLHQQQQQSLYNQRQAALDTAQKALQDGDTAAAKEAVTAAQDLAKQQLDTQKEAAAEKQQITTDALNASKAATTSQSDAIDELTKLATSGVNSLSDDQLKQFDQQLGATGMTQAIFSGAVEKEKNKEDIDFATSLGKLPPGTTVTRDGHTYTSTAVGKLTKVTEKAKDGTVTTVFYNPDGSVHNSSQFNVGGSGNNSSNAFNVKTATPEMENAILAQLKQDNNVQYLAKEDWDTLLSQWENAGGSRKSFISAFSKYANPAAGYDYSGIKPVANKTGKQS